MSSLETPANNCSIISIGNLTEKTSYLVKLLSINTYGVRKIQLGNICKIKLMLHQKVKRNFKEFLMFA